MAQVIKIKRSSTTAVPSSLQNGELAYSSNGNKLFIGRPGGTTGDVDVIGGKYYTDIVDAATSSNTASTLVLRDASGNFSAGTITATTFSGALSGNASSADVWSSSRTFTFTGDVAGSFTTDGSADVSNIALTIQANSVALGTDTTGDYVATLADSGAGNLVITGSGEGAAATINLSTTGVTANTYGSSTAIPSITVDSYGRITSVTTNTISTDLAIAADSGTDSIALGSETLTFTGGTLITTSAVADSSEITIDHDAVTRTDTTSSASPAFNGTFDVVDSVTTSSEGHITAVNVKTVTLPVEADTLATVTGRGATTTDDITVNNIRVTAGNITGPATITIDPDAAGSAGEVVIAGNLTVTGTTTTINSNTVSVGDSIIMLNGDETAAPSQNAGIEVERGTSSNVSLIWNETTDKWQLTSDGASYTNLLTVANFETEITTLDGGTF